MKRILDVVLSMELDGRFLQDMFSLLILHHDIGKLANEYQTRDFYRHEALSAHILYHQFVEARQASEETDLLAAIFAAATYLHHEALQISHNHFEMREPTYSYLLNWLSPWEYHMVEMSDELLGQLNKRLVPTCVIAPFSLKNKLIAGREVAMTLASVMTAVDGCAEPLAVRMAVASVLHPLTICDNRAANMRGGVPSVFSTALMEYLIEGAISGDEQ
jgi:CRISPR/Cas system-associated endonuclease Cas3-HD